MYWFIFNFVLYLSHSFRTSWHTYSQTCMRMVNWQWNMGGACKHAANGGVFTCKEFVLIHGWLQVQEISKEVM
jgi:hypothetical protein